MLFSLPTSGRFLLLFPLWWLLSVPLSGQGRTISGQVVDGDGAGIPFATIAVPGSDRGTVASAAGKFLLEDLTARAWQLRVTALGYAETEITVDLGPGDATALRIGLESTNSVLEEVVVTGTMKKVSRLRSPVPVEVYTAEFFRANPTPSVFESLQHVNGVRPQLNCAVCNTGDIHINGLEGPYTMVLIDGMPIVSGLSTVYGLTGIPRSLIARTEVVKGPASTLYGSEAVGGLINVITKDPVAAPRLAAEVMVSGWGEVNTDLGLKTGIGERVHGLLGVNYFNYRNPVDQNGDGFTDLTLQDRISVFSKWSFDRREDRAFTLAGRYVYEDRWGGQLDWDRGYRGGEEIYGESIFTSRWEAFGTYRLPLREAITFQFSANGHDQNSAYGSTLYLARQYVGFGQLSWNRRLGRHDLLLGTAFRYTWYDDNTPVTAGFGDDAATNRPARTHLPGAFVQDEWRWNDRHTLLLGLRYDHNSLHGSILTPRLNFKWNTTDHKDVLRLSLGNGYRVANVFTEDHAALTGAREVVFAEALAPETSWNANLNYTKKLFLGEGTVIGLDASTWYTFFQNRILPDYETDPNAIIYANLDGRAVSRGASLNVDLSLAGGLGATLGLTVQDVFVTDDGERERPLLTEGGSAVWTVTVPFTDWHTRLDYTGNLYAPMRLPLLGPLDDRPAESPWFSTQNLQLTKTFANGMEVFGGVKNLLDYTPPANSIARAFDPFDRDVTFAADGSVLATPGNPRALTFDPTYVFASNQGRRLFLGMRWNLQ